MFKRRNILWVISIILTAILTSTFTVVVMAAIPLNPISGDGVISAAYQKVNGMLRLINGPSDVNPSETYISWNQQGPIGPPGPAGPPGASGATGSFNATQWQQVLNNTSNASAHYALTSAHGVSGNIVGTTGNQILSWNNTLINGFVNMTPGSGYRIIDTNDNFIIKGSTFGDVAIRNSTNTAYANLRAAWIYVQGAISLVTNGAMISASNIDNAYASFQARKSGSGLVEVARVQGGNSTYSNTAWFEMTTPPKFGAQNVNGPSNNTTPVTWVPILLTDNTTAYLPAYK